MQAALWASLKAHGATFDPKYPWTAELNGHKIIMSSNSMAATVVSSDDDRHYSTVVGVLNRVASKSRGFSVPGRFGLRVTLWPARTGGYRKATVRTAAGMACEERRSADPMFVSMCQQLVEGDLPVGVFLDWLGDSPVEVP